MINTNNGEIRMIAVRFQLDRHAPRAQIRHTYSFVNTGNAIKIRPLLLFVSNATPFIQEQKKMDQGKAFNLKVGATHFKL